MQFSSIFRDVARVYAKIPNNSFLVKMTIPAANGIFAGSTLAYYKYICCMDVQAFCTNEKGRTNRNT